LDSITQITLGAAVGEAVLGKKMGNKAAAWGAFFGVVPDMDVLASPFVSNVQELVIHRGISHSLFFSVVAPPLFGWMLQRWYQRAATRDTAYAEVTWQQWAWLVFWAIITHIFIDSLTNYGTQIFQPFSNYALSLNTIFIIDPLYTVPLMVGVVGALFMRQASRNRRVMNGVGIALSSLYLLWGAGVKLYVDSVFEENFQVQEIPVERYMSNPMPFNSLLWVTYARTDDAVYAGLYSIMDEDQLVDFTRIPTHDNLLDPYRDDLAVERVLWFSQGYYAVRKQNEQLIFSDLRFGRSDLWLTSDPAGFAWSYSLIKNKAGNKIIGIERQVPNFDAGWVRLKQLWQRIFGRTVFK
jgi:inner membrane protein